jgi:bacteriocin-like protein
MTKYETEHTAPEVLTDEQLEKISGGFNPTAIDPTNPLCPEPRPRPGSHKG